MTPEFDLIQTYFSQLTPLNQNVTCGIGDDAAILNIPTNKQLVVSVDTLVEEIHFFKNMDPYRLGHKALAVNLSDMAAMGATPAFFTLALSLPDIDKIWLKGFSKGLADLAQQFDLSLIGGDTTKGAKTISIQIMGFVEKDQAVFRHNAQIDDDIYITGVLGDAALALQQLYAQKRPKEQLKEALEMPTPRIKIGIELTPFIHAMIDISDGLMADLGHICNASHCGATLFLEKIPLSLIMQTYIKQTQDWSLVLSGGEDYELCFSAPSKYRQRIQHISQQYHIPINRIGIIKKNKKIDIVRADKTYYTQIHTGYDHFKKNKKTL